MPIFIACLAFTEVPSSDHCISEVTVENDTLKVAATETVNQEEKDNDTPNELATLEVTVETNTLKVAATETVNQEEKDNDTPNELATLEASVETNTLKVAATETVNQEEKDNNTPNELAILTAGKDEGIIIYLQLLFVTNSFTADITDDLCISEDKNNDLPNSTTGAISEALNSSSNGGGEVIASTAREGTEYPVASSNSVLQMDGASNTSKYARTFDVYKNYNYRNVFNLFTLWAS